MKVYRLVVCLALSAFSVAQTSNPPLAPLLSRIWRVTSPTPYPNSGSIYIFLPNGSLFEGSCVETYRIATWKPVPQKPGTIEVTEDGRPAFTASIASSTEKTLRLRQTLAFGNHEVRELDLAAVDKEFVCPDLPK